MSWGFFAYLFYMFNTYYNNNDMSFKDETPTFCILAITFACFGVTVFFFWSVHHRDPGRVQKIDKQVFYLLIDKAVKEGRNLNYFCFYCRSIWSATGYHCMICGTCVEGLDHHCQFIDNCIGYRNHSHFLNFLGSAFAYTSMNIRTNVWMFFRHLELCEIKNKPVNSKLCDENSF